MLPIKAPFAIATHVKKYTTTTGSLTTAGNKTKAASIGVVSGALHFHNGTALARVAAAVTGAAFNIAAGSSVMASGTVVVATGLAGVKGFAANPSGTQVGTGAANQQILFTSFTGTTGDVTVAAWYVSTIGASGVMAAATGSSGTFNWVAMGT